MMRRVDSPYSTAERPVSIQVPIVERAFTLAASGEFRDPTQIAQQLESEGYLDVQEHIRDFPLLRRQLREAARRAQQN